ncbi:HTH domain-containing protein [Iodidimonas sp. SYSU 1G8]|uniref:HTH domain-containing protein n=1 Tax=Iodidimonas sp. SYSU 1G8 TaxID=3133967 RepID=UPI0031FECAF5
MTRPPCTDKGSRPRLTTPSRAELERKSRIFGYELGIWLCEIMPRYSAIFGSDFTKVLIVNAIGIASVHRLMNRPEGVAFESITSIVPSELQVPVNAMSIAESTGIPRETVRRKIKEMIADGLVIEDDRSGYRLMPGALQSQGSMEIYYAQLQSLVTMVNRLMDAGLLRVDQSQNKPARPLNLGTHSLDPNEPTM